MHPANVGHQFYQLPMWMTAHELMHGTDHGDLDAYDDHDEMWATKRKDNADVGRGRGGRGVDPKDVRLNGVEHPVWVQHLDDRPYLIDGHHRTVAAYDVDPHMLVPVEHAE
jgi:hypothetical protein